MEKKLRKIYQKIVKNNFGIIFGILSGAGLMFVLTNLVFLGRTIFPAVEPYSFIIYIILFLFVLTITTINYARGWFKIFYLGSSLVLFITQIYVEIFGII